MVRRVEAKTHLAIDTTLCGRPHALAAGSARVALDTLGSMAADARGLVHGGFVFGLADYAAMLAVNHPHVVLAEAHSRFLRPVRVGERVVATATVSAAQGRRHEVRVQAHVDATVVFEGTFVCFVLAGHVLDREGK